ncbi:Uncharacterised protein [Mycobacteroides abscessus subsp. abscessus]|nr:Uncharacterised protein [Mycobacteroides abscessus subsp. abscessus]
MAQIIAVEQVCDLPRLHQRTFHRHRDRRFAGCRQAGEPDDGAALSGAVPTVFTIQRRWVPPDIGA